jgi:putative SOS response-associated peptidase YedK
MCGRYAVLKTVRDRESERLFRGLVNAEIAFAGVPRYNASPMQQLPVIAVRDGVVRADAMQWWLVPHGSKDGKPMMGKDGTPLKTFNAKGETLATSRLYAPYFRSARCLVPAEAFYEWKTLRDQPTLQSGKQPKQPMAIRLKEGRSFMFAGLFSVWQQEGREGKGVGSFSIITTQANELMSQIHQRMPVILREADYDRWLDRSYKDTDALQELIRPYSAKDMEAFAVSRFVNNSKNEGPECLTPASEGWEPRRTTDGQR